MMQMNFKATLRGKKCQTNLRHYYLISLKKFWFFKNQHLYPKEIIPKKQLENAHAKNHQGHPPLRLFRPRSLPEVPTLFRCQWVIASASVSGFWEGKWRVEMVHFPCKTKVNVGRLPIFLVDTIKMLVMLVWLCENYMVILIIFYFHP